MISIGPRDTKKRITAMRILTKVTTLLFLAAISIPQGCAHPQESGHLCKTRISGDGVFSILQDSKGQIIRSSIFMRNPKDGTYSVESDEISVLSKDVKMGAIAEQDLLRSLKNDGPGVYLVVNGENIVNMEIVRRCDADYGPILEMPVCCGIEPDQGEMVDSLNALDMVENNSFDAAGRSGQRKSQTITDPATVELALKTVLSELDLAHHALGQVTARTARYRNAKQQVDEMLGHYLWVVERHQREMTSYLQTVRGGK
jgi:hypothetical protein